MSLPQVRGEVLARLGREAWRDAGTSNVYVEGGTVVLQGLVNDARARIAAHRIAEAVPGVLRVWDARVVPREG
jgi:osmotically-inducible protein OsmY